MLPRERSRHNGDLTTLRRGYRGPATTCIDRDAPPPYPGCADEPPGGGAGLLHDRAGSVWLIGQHGHRVTIEWGPRWDQVRGLHARARGAELPRPGFEPRDPDHAVACIPVGPERVSALAGRRSGLGTPIGAGPCSAAADIRVHASPRHLALPRPADWIAAVQPGRLQPDPRYARVLPRHPELDRPTFACLQTGGDRMQVRAAVPSLTRRAEFARVESEKDHGGACGIGRSDKRADLRRRRPTDSSRVLDLRRYAARGGDRGLRADISDGRHLRDRPVGFVAAAASVVWLAIGRVPLRAAARGLAHEQPAGARRPFAQSVRDGLPAAAWVSAARAHMASRTSTAATAAVVIARACDPTLR